MCAKDTESSALLVMEACSPDTSDMLAAVALRLLLSWQLLSVAVEPSLSDAVPSAGLRRLRTQSSYKSGLTVGV